MPPIAAASKMGFIVITFCLSSVSRLSASIGKDAKGRDQLQFPTGDLLKFGANNRARGCTGVAVRFW